MEKTTMSVITKSEAIKQLIDLNSRYIDALANAQKSDLALTAKKQELTDAKEAIIVSVDPKELGSNAEIREANLNARLKDKVLEIRELETIHSTNQMHVNVAKSSVNVVHRILDALSSPSVAE
jgi:hypothetical protein